MGMFSSLVNNIQSTWPDLEAGDRTVKKITSLLSWGLRSSVQRRKSPYSRGYLCVCGGGCFTEKDIWTGHWRMNRSLRKREGKESYIRQEKEMVWQVSGKGKRMMHPVPILASPSPTPLSAPIIWSAAFTAWHPSIDPQYLGSKSCWVFLSGMPFSTSPLLSQQTSFKPWQASPCQWSRVPFGIEVSLVKAGVQSMSIGGALGSSIPIKGRPRFQAGTGRTLCTAESRRSRKSRT